MKKLIVTLLLMIPVYAIAQINIAGVPLGTPVADFEAQINAKTTELAEIAHAKKCKITINEYLPGDVQTACVVDVKFEYKSTQSDMGFAVIRSLLNKKYGDNKEREVMTAISTSGLFWRTPYGEVALFRYAGSVVVRIFDYVSIENAYPELLKVL